MLNVRLFLFLLFFSLSKLLQVESRVYFNVFEVLQGFNQAKKSCEDYDGNMHISKLLVMTQLRDHIRLQSSLKRKQSTYINQKT